MNESSPTERPQAFPGRSAALRLGAALLAALVLTLAMVMSDNARRSTLEVIVETTAVGDTRYLAIPEVLPAKPYPAVAKLDGRPLVPTSYKRHDRRDANLRSVGRDESTGLTIYQEPAGKSGKTEADTYFLKAGPGEFVKVRPADAAK